ncbi:neurturin [Trichomycterus rosablanca]|uniref:neurturin n=1 Tax=Trichomycterus rosablanca TaxID=2290929 RepID=UPI002F350A3C
MKLWKCVSIILMLCGAALSIFLSKVLISPKAHVSSHLGLLSSSSSSSESSPAPASLTSTNSSSSSIGERLRRVRSANGDSSVASEFMHIFQSFTEGELKQVIDALVRRKAQRNSKQSKRTKRAKKGSKPCSLHDVEVTVSQLGLGYVSDETVLFRYCSGKCVASRSNYDLALRFLKRNHLLTRGSGDRARHVPCCRPTAFEPDIAFLDNRNGYNTIHEIFAQECGCV